MSSGVLGGAENAALEEDELAALEEDDRNNLGRRPKSMRLGTPPKAKMGMSLTLSGLSRWRTAAMDFAHRFVKLTRAICASIVNLDMMSCVGEVGGGNDVVFKAS
jgi:hypothetical protein